MKADTINFDQQIGEVGRMLTEHEKMKGVLIHALHRIQEDNGYLPEDVLRRLSQNLNIPLSEIYSVATFYKMFHFKPRGRKVVKVCLGTACYVRGSKKVLTSLETEFNVRNGETTDDRALTLETVGCVGCCGLAPVATINDDVIGEIMSKKKLDVLIKSIREE